MHVTLESRPFNFLCNVETQGFVQFLFSFFSSGDQIGRVILGGGCLFGIGSLCYYGLGLSGEAGAIDRAG